MENHLYVKAEKCEFHVPSITFLAFILEGGPVSADPTKTQTIKDWPVSEMRKQLQRFLGFANFYCRFIKDFSKIAIQLTALTSTKKSFHWTPEADQAFNHSKELFTQMPILHHLDPTRQFILEVDASDSAIGAILSQRSPQDQKLHPCAYFYKRFCPAERCYYIGARELLAIKLALEEWRHRLARNSRF